jgi:hypothetical protein
MFIKGDRYGNTVLHAGIYYSVVSNLNIAFNYSDQKSEWADPWAHKGTIWNTPIHVKFISHTYSQRYTRFSGRSTRLSDLDTQ